MRYIGLPAKTGIQTHLFVERILARFVDNQYMPMMMSNDLILIKLKVRGNVFPKITVEYPLKLSRTGTKFPMATLLSNT